MSASLLKDLYQLKLSKLKAQEESYRQEVADWYENGDGRKSDWRRSENGKMRNYGGKGYRFPYCPHGTDLWTDYDNICGPCEDGFSVEQLAQWAAESALSEAHMETKARLDWIKADPESQAYGGDLMALACKPIDDLHKAVKKFKRQ